MRRRWITCGVALLFALSFACTNSGEKAYESGMQLWDEGEFHEAAAVLREVRRIYPDSPYAASALFKAGQIQSHDLRQPEKAEETFRLFRKFYPNHPLAERAQDELSTLYFSKSKDYWKAIAASRVYVENYPLSVEVPKMRHRIVRSHLRLRDYAAAREEAALFLRKYPNHEFADEVAYQIPQSFFIAGEPEKAADEARKFLSERPQSPRTARMRFLLAAALEDLDRLVEAKEVYEAVRDTHPEPDVVDAKIAAVADRLERKHK